MKKVEVGVIGAGYWGKKIIKEYLRLANENEVVLKAICDTNGHDIGDNFGVSLVYQDYRKLLENREIDAVNICTPNETHYRISAKALNAGKHVLLEKPMTLKASEAYDLINLAKRKGLNLSVGHVFRFNNALRKVKELVHEGFFGDLYYIDLQWTTLFNPPDRDIITDLSPHPFDILNFLTGMWPKGLACIAKGYRGNGREDMAFISLEFDNRVIGHMHLSWLIPGKDRTVRIIGSDKSAKIDCISQEVIISYGAETFGLEVQQNNTIESELTHFIECVRHNHAGAMYTNHADGDIGARVVELLEAARKSTELNKPVQVDYGKG